jgi:hypothetical protein
MFQIPPPLRIFWIIGIAEDACNARLAVLRRDCHGRALAHVLFETLEPSNSLTGTIAVGNLGHRFDVKNLDRVEELRCGIT